MINANFYSEMSKCMSTDTCSIKIGNKEITECKKGKLLGVTIDKHINMVEHIQKIWKQASNKLHVLARISNLLDERKRKILMKSFVISQFNYCPIVWMFCQRRSNNLINKIHERALRIPYNDYESDFETLIIIIIRLTCQFHLKWVARQKNENRICRSDWPTSSPTVNDTINIVSSPVLEKFVKNFHSV